MRNIIIMSVALLMIAGIALAGDQLVVTGSTTVLPIAQACAEDFMDNNPNTDVTVRGGGSGVGIAALLDKQCDIAMASRDIKSSEVDAARGKGIEPVEHVVAFDALAIVVHPKNKVTNLTIEQVKDIFTGKITKWSQVGGANKKIVLISRDVSSGTFEVFKDVILKGDAVHESALKVASNQAVATSVGNTPDGIGYIGLGYINKNVKAVYLNSVKATVKTAQSGEYPLTRKLNMYSDGAPTGKAKAYLDYIFSKEGQAIVAELGFVPVK